MYGIAVIGSGGFLGSAISRSLAHRGHRVTGFTRADPVLSDGQLARAAATAQALVWAAGGVSPTVAAEHPELVAEELKQFRRFADAVACLDAPPRVLLLSSGGTVYGPPSAPPFSERDEPHPPNAYGAYKLAEERALENAGVEATAVRIANAYGPGQRGARGQGVLAVWMRAVLMGEPIRIHGAGGVARDYVYVDDVTDAIARLVEHPSPAPRSLNVGSGSATDLDGLLAVLTDVVGVDRMTVERLPSRGVDAASTWLDVSLAREAIGWTPGVGLTEGVARMWRWMETQ